MEGTKFFHIWNLIGMNRNRKDTWKCFNQPYGSTHGIASIDHMVPCMEMFQSIIWFHAWNCFKKPYGSMHGIVSINHMVPCMELFQSYGSTHAIVSIIGFPVSGYHSSFPIMGECTGEGRRGLVHV